MKATAQQTKLNFLPSIRDAIEIISTPAPANRKPDDKAATLAIARQHGTAYQRNASTAPLTPAPSQRSSQPDYAHPSCSLFSTPAEPLHTETMETLPDSTDWIQTALPQFEPLEAALRCEICKEFFENPVLTECNHTFCSLCIRRCVTRDGKCPACLKQVRTERLVANFVVREIVGRFQDARPAALELAKKVKEEDDNEGEVRGKRKRKLSLTDIEEEEPARQTRSRVTRSSSRRGNGMADAPFEVADSEDEGDDLEFIPDGMVACPMCATPMKEESVWAHLNTCSGEQKPKSGRGTQLRANNSFSSPARGKPKSTEPAPSRLPGINFAMLTEAKARKKLQELGIPTWGKKDLMMKRHTEWLHLWNSNCDASEESRKTKRELLKQLDVWERTQGGNAHTVEAAVMKKDFDTKGYAGANKGQFADLIAAARKKIVPKVSEPTEESNNRPQEPEREDAVMEEAQNNAEFPTHHTDAPQHHSSETYRPYDGNFEAIATIREKVNDTNESGAIQPSSFRGEEATFAPPNQASESNSTPTGIANPFGSPTRKLPMFALPQDPVDDVETSNSAFD